MRTRCLPLVFAALLCSARAAAETRGRAPAGGGLAAVEATFDLEAGVLKTRVGEGGWRAIPIAIDKSWVDPKTASIEAIAIGEGKHLLHARIGDRQRKDLAFEALLAGKEGEPLLALLTGPSRGEQGERSGQVLRLFERDDHTKQVIVADIREDTRICGQEETLLLPRGLDPKTLQLRGATMHRLDKQLREGATNVVAAARSADAKAPLARLLQARGGSAANASALTDGNTESTWSEQRPGDGHGEFVSMSAPADLPLHTIVVTVAPPTGAKPTGAAPRTFFLATDRELFRVTMPEDAWAKPGASYEVPLPKPVATSCVALVLDEAYPRNLDAPEVTLAELNGRGKFDADGATHDDVAKELAGPRGEEAAALLRRSGEPGLAAVTKVWPSLDASGRAFAVDVASSSGGCSGPASDLLTLALADADGEVRKRGLGRLERCGKAAAGALAKAVRSEDEPLRATAAPLLATIAPNAAIEPIGEMLGKGKPTTRRALRAALARASASATREQLVALLARTDTGRLEAVRALGPRLHLLDPQAQRAVNELLAANPDMATRWLLAEPLAQLGGTSGKQQHAQLAALVTSDPDAAVRARAIEVSAELPPLAPAIVAAARDREPRVREAAFKAMAAGRITSGASAANEALASDAWTFVRVAAAEALGTIGTGVNEARLGEALAEPSPRVRAAALTALAKLGAVRWTSAVRARLDDATEDVEVRALAARTLGELCARSAVDHLTRLALASRQPADELADRLGMSAVDALARIHPPDLEQRLAPLRAKDVRTPVRLAAERAIKTPGSCR